MKEMAKQIKIRETERQKVKPNSPKLYAQPPRGKR
jgi:hypothetical protein